MDFRFGSFGFFCLDFNMSEVLLESETVALCPSMLNQTWGSGSPRREPSLDVLNLSGLEFEAFHNLLPLRPRIYVSSANLSVYTC